MSLDNDNDIYAKVCFGRVLNIIYSAHWMQVKLSSSFLLCIADSTQLLLEKHPSKIDFKFLNGSVLKNRVWKDFRFSARPYS